MRNVKSGILLLVVTAFMLLACESTPLPEDKLDYAGEWESAEMYLLILKDGSLNYRRLKKGTTTSVSGSITEFQGDNFVSGVSFITTTFVVTKPPHKVDDTWKMVVDGVELTKTR